MDDRNTTGPANGSGIQLEGTAPIGSARPGSDSDGDAAAQLRSSTGADAQDGATGATSDAPDTRNTKVEDLPQSNAATGIAGSQDQTKVYGAPETTDYSPAGNPPDRPTVISTNDRDTITSGPESIGAGGAGNPTPNAEGASVADGNDPTPRGNPDAPQGTGPDVNSRTLSSRERNNVQGKVRQAGDK
jgi:hypothetical protein